CRDKAAGCGNLLTGGEGVDRGKPGGAAPCGEGGGMRGAARADCARAPRGAEGRGGRGRAERKRGRRRDEEGTRRGAGNGGKAAGPQSSGTPTTVRYNTPWVSGRSSSSLARSS